MFDKDKQAIVKNIQALLGERKWKLQDLSERMRSPRGGFRPPGYVSDTLKRPGLPTMEFLLEVSRVFEVNIALLVSDYFEEFAQKIAKNIVADSIKSIFSGPISIPQLLNWHAQHGGKLKEWDQFKENVDVYLRPTTDDISVTPYRMGRDSLATRIMGVRQPAAVKRKLMDAPKSYVDNLSASHIETLEKGEPSVEVISLDVTLLTGQRVRENYAILRLPVEVEKAGAGVVASARPLPSDFSSEAIKEIRAG